MKRCALLLLLLCELTALAGAAVPDWFRDAGKITSTTASPAAAPAKILYDAAAITVQRNGTYDIRLRRATLILSTAGKKHAEAFVPYERGAAKVRSLKAWITRPGHRPEALKSDYYGDIALFGSNLELYTEARARLALAADLAEPGTIFGYEAEIEDRSLLGQRTWMFQAPLAIEHSTLSVTLPPEWTLAAHIFNHPPFEPRIDGATRTWELRNLPAFKDEPLGLTLRAGAAWLALDILPPAMPGRSPVRRTFRSWTEISQFFKPAYEAAAAPDDALRTRAAAITANAKTEWDKISALCRAAQTINYISIQLDSANAGGLFPRPASRVLQCNYGDCKDKATLLRSLLSASGIESWPVALFAGDRHRVQPDWPSPEQFNHVILAIRLTGEPPDRPATLQHPTLGRILLFDPTDQFTPPGLLPAADQGGFGLLMAGADGGLFALPKLDLQRSNVSREVQVRLDADGSIAGTITETYRAEESSEARAKWRLQAPPDYRRDIEHWLNTTLTGAKINRSAPIDDFAHATFSLAVDFEAPRYGKPLGSDLLVLKPILAARHGAVVLTTEPRVGPVALEPKRFHEKIEIALAAGFAADELTPVLELRTDFASYQARVATTNGKLVVERTLETRDAIVPASGYERVRTFFAAVAQNEQTPVILKRGAVTPAQ